MLRQKGETLRDLQHSVWLTRDDKQLNVMFDQGAQIIRSAMVALSASTGSHSVSKHLPKGESIGEKVS